VGQTASGNEGTNHGQRESPIVGSDRANRSGTCCRWESKIEGRI